MISNIANLGGFIIKNHETTVTIPDGGTSTQTKMIDVSSIIPDGKALYGALIWLGQLNLPYVRSDNTPGTWIDRVSSDGKISIKNRGSAWNNYIANCILFIK